MRKLLLLAVLLAFLSLALAPVILGHGGGLDDYGGHFDRRTGTYHYHRSPGWRGTLRPRSDGYVPPGATRPKSATKAGKSKASKEVSIVVDGKRLAAKGVIVSGKAMVPARAISQALGMEIQWEQKTRTVRLSRPRSPANPAVGPAAGPGGP